MLNIFPFKQTDSSRCGPASIKMVLSYYGIDALEEEICRRCNWTYELGCTDFQMKEAIESFGLGCIIQNESTLEDLEYWVKYHIPVIVDWLSPGVSPTLEDMPNGHSSVVVDIDREVITLLDPELGGLRTIRREEFMRVWVDWREDPYLQRCSDLVLRQIIIPYPIKLKEMICKI